MGCSDSVEQIRPSYQRSKQSPASRDLRIIPEESSYISSTKSEGNISPLNAELPKSLSQTKLFNPYFVNPEQAETVAEERSSLVASRSRKFKVSTNR
jgi:hypothetical protein